MRNESPIGLATLLGLAPAVIGAAVFVVLLVVNGGDVDKAQQMGVAIAVGASLVGTAWLRQWRAVSGTTSAPTPATQDPGALDEGDAGSAVPEG